MPDPYLNVRRKVSQGEQTETRGMRAIPAMLVAVALASAVAPSAGAEVEAPASAKPIPSVCVVDGVVQIPCEDDQGSVAAAGATT